MNKLIILIKILITIPLWLLTFPIAFDFGSEVIDFLNGDYEPLGFLLSMIMVLTIVNLLMIIISTLWDKNDWPIPWPFFNPNARTWFKENKYDLLEKYELT